MSENIILQNEENVLIATFNIATPDTTTTLKNLTGMTEIDWGDGTVNSELSHAYVETGEYTCRVYGVTSIGERAFEGCTSLTSVEIGDSVTSIGFYAFGDCSSLTSVVIPNSVTSIGATAFYGCDNLQYNEKDNLKYLGNSNNPCLYLAGVISTEITEANIDANCRFIGTYVFYGCDSLTSVEIPDSVTSIGDYVFYYCSSLTSVVIPDGVTSIGYAAFGYCSSLESVVIGDSITTIGNDAFYSCSSLTSVVIGGSVTSIGSAAFYSCKSLTSVVIPNSVTSIGDDAFSYCRSLTSVVIGDSVTSIGDRAFRDCDSLTSVYITDITAWCKISGLSNLMYYGSSNKQLYLNDQLITELVIPDGVTMIGEDAFKNCSSLTSITIGDSVTSIENDAFSGCSSLTSVTFSSLIPLTVSTLTYSDINNENLTYYVPQTAVETYRSAWMRLVNSNRILPSLDTYFINLTGLQTYHNTLKEKHLDVLQSEVDKKVDLTNDQEIGGVKTFTAPIKINTETVATQEWIMQYIQDNFATLMAQYLNSVEATENKPTETDISSVFDAEEEA